MRRLFCVALLLLSFAYGSIAVAAISGGSIRKSHTPYVSSRRSRYQSDGWEPIRIAVNGDGIMDDIENCAEFRDKSSMYGVFFRMLHPSYDYRICREIRGLGHDNVVEFFNKNVYDVVKLHTDRLLVKPVGKSLKVLDDDQYAYHGPCRALMPPIEDKESGVHNADVVVYLSLTSRVPLAEVCRRDDKGRPTVVSIKLRTEDILGRDNKYVRLLAHMMAHGIGFDSMLNKIGVTSSAEEDSETEVTYKIEDEEMRENLKKFFKCSNGVSVLKMERHGIDRRELHFPKSVVTGELMSPYYDGSSPMVYTPLTLAVFESTGYFKADFENAQRLPDWNDIGKAGVECKELN